ncbi:MAG: TetR/AcrR family transcriptional regulator [Hyphomicrobium sp.]
MTSMEVVRERILTHGLGLASASGLHALSMGELARDLDLSKSGLFAHFATKESLQLGVLDQAASMFIRDVIDAADGQGPGEPHLRALFNNWIAWSRSPRLKGGCPFVHASAESDALPEPVRARLKEVLDAWNDTLKSAIEAAKAAGTFSADLDADQLVFELTGHYLSHHFWHWSMKDRSALARTKKALDRLVAAAKVCAG